MTPKGYSTKLDFFRKSSSPSGRPTFKKVDISETELFDLHTKIDFGKSLVFQLQKIDFSESELFELRSVCQKRPV
jgi:hypothetical protein